MTAQKVDTEAMMKLVHLTQDFQERVRANKRVLLNAAALCDQAMGNDPIIQKKIRRLRAALESLDYATDEILEAAHEAIRRDIEEIEAIVEEA